MQGLCPFCVEWDVNLLRLCASGGRPHGAPEQDGTHETVGDDGEQHEGGHYVAGDGQTVAVDRQELGPHAVDVRGRCRGEVADGRPAAVGPPRHRHRDRRTPVPSTDRSCFTPLDRRTSVDSAAGV